MFRAPPAHKQPAQTLADVIKPVLESEGLAPHNPTQAELDAFILRAGFTYGWLNLESSARRMAERAVIELHAAKR